MRSMSAALSQPMEIESMVLTPPEPSIEDPLRWLHCVTVFDRPVLGGAPGVGRLYSARETKTSDVMDDARASFRTLGIRELAHIPWPNSTHYITPYQTSTSVSPSSAVDQARPPALGSSPKNFMESSLR